MGGWVLINDLAWGKTTLESVISRVEKRWLLRVRIEYFLPLQRLLVVTVCAPSPVVSILLLDCWWSSVRHSDVLLSWLFRSIFRTSIFLHIAGESEWRALRTFHRVSLSRLRWRILTLIIVLTILVIDRSIIQVHILLIFKFALTYRDSSWEIPCLNRVNSSILSLHHQNLVLILIRHVLKFLLLMDSFQPFFKWHLSVLGSGLFSPPLRIHVTLSLILDDLSFEPSPLSLLRFLRPISSPLRRWLALSFLFQNSMSCFGHLFPLKVLFIGNLCCHILL